MGNTKRVNEDTIIQKRSKQWLSGVNKAQRQILETGENILINILKGGIASVNKEYKEALYYDIQELTDYYSPGIIRNFRQLYNLLCSAENPTKHHQVIAQINHLLVLIQQGKKYIDRRKEWSDIDTTSTIESRIGYLWRNRDLLEHKLYETDTEIIQLSFNSIKDNSRKVYIDKGYWANLKDGRIHYTTKTRPFGAGRFIKKEDTENDVLQPHLLFLQPGRINRRIRWDEAKTRKVTSGDLTALHHFAHTDYHQVVQTIKQEYRDPLTEQTPTVLIKLHKAFINGDLLTLEDQYGNYITLMDLPNDSLPTTPLLQTILPAKAMNYTLLVQTNNDTENNLFSMKPLAILTEERIIRLLF